MAWELVNMGPWSGLGLSQYYNFKTFIPHNFCRYSLDKLTFWLTFSLGKVFYIKRSFCSTPLRATEFYAEKILFVLIFYWLKYLITKHTKLVKSKQDDRCNFHAEDVAKLKLKLQNLNLPSDVEVNFMNLHLVHNFKISVGISKKK